jgi:hypothetical protein
MKKLFLTLFLLSGISMTKAQMRFGTGDVLDPNAVVQIDTADGTRKGLLMPRLRLFSTNSFAPLGAHVAGMIVYNTSTSGSDPFKVFPGYYYNDGTKWNRVLSEQEINKVWLNVSDGSPATAATPNVYRNGRIGIGVNNPSESIDVNGNIKVGGGTGTGQVFVKQGSSSNSGSLEITNPANQLVGAIGILPNHMNYHTEDTLKHHVFTGGNLAIGTTTAPVKLVINGALKLGDEAKTANSPEEGMIRYNKILGRFEGYNGTSWVSLHE